MPRIFTASDRRSLIRLASTLEKGSDERRAILAGLYGYGGASTPFGWGKDPVSERLFHILKKAVDDWASALDGVDPTWRKEVERGEGFPLRGSLKVFEDIAKQLRRDLKAHDFSEARPNVSGSVLGEGLKVLLDSTRLAANLGEMYPLVDGLQDFSVIASVQYR